jgi:hypothetical protein
MWLWCGGGIHAMAWGGDEAGRVRTHCVKCGGETNVGVGVYTMHRITKKRAKEGKMRCVGGDEMVCAGV